MTSNARTPMKAARYRRVLIVHFGLIVLLIGYVAWHRHRTASLDVPAADSATYDYAPAMRHARQAEIGIAAIVATTLSLTLVTGVIFGRGLPRLLLGNLYVLLVLLVMLDVLSPALGLRFSAIPRPGEIVARGLWAYHSTLGWYHSPRARGWTPSQHGEPLEVTINSMGTRGTEARTKTDALTRVLVFGDSFVFGVGVAQDQVLSSRLQHHLAPRVQGELEVINMGVSGYSTDQELLLFEQTAEALKPDIVVLVVCANDYLANAQDFVYQQYYKPYFELDDDGALHRRNVPVPTLSALQQVKLFLGRESNLWNFFRTLDDSVPGAATLRDRLAIATSKTPRRPHKVTRALVELFAARASSVGARLLVTNTGVRNQAPFGLLSRHLRADGTAHFDMVPVLESAIALEPARDWLQDDGADHWDRDAHDLVGSTLADYLERHFLNPEIASE